ncbi:hypothetical protein HK098_002682 [Nowakowskiella sp. JEL0407]|nr:hypothetical protein HK098_002682 [Nowakowskiella sp. JEL0407]
MKRFIPTLINQTKLHTHKLSTFSQFTSTRISPRNYVTLSLKANNVMVANEMYEKLVSGDRAALARAITLVESSHPTHKGIAQELLSMILAKRNSEYGVNVGTESDPLKTTFRIGLSGSPGVGKSSFIETFGMFLLHRGHKVAVLAVDPSSARTGGSILGDKTRMGELSRSIDAYVRPSPSSGTLGGVARNTNEAILLCEAGGYDIILIETVGVGQSETMVADMVDMFVLLVAPAGGDELQGMKKGIMEVSDLVLVNKSDGDFVTAARIAQMEYISAMKFIQPLYEGWKPDVLRLSSAEKTGIDEAWKSMLTYYQIMESSGQLMKRRGKQGKVWMWRQLQEELLQRLRTSEKVKSMLQTMETEVFNGKITSGYAADSIIAAFVDEQ